MDLNTFDRHRRLRRSATMRKLVRETVLRKEDLIYPLFIAEGSNIKNEVSSMPGVYQISLDLLDNEIEELLKLDIPGVLLFGIPEAKDEVGSGAYAEDGIVQKAIRQIKNKTSDLLIIADTCLCEYTSHGHCGVIHNGDVDNDESLPLHVKTAITQAQAGADIIAPSNMMDGFVAEIRQGLDEA